MKTLFTNGIFHTMEVPEDLCGSIVVEDGLIAALDAPAGGREPLDADALERGGLRVVDLGGRHVFPALIDSHLHLMDSLMLAAAGEPLCALRGGRVEPHDLAGVAARVRASAARAAEALREPSGPRAARRPSPILAFTSYMASAIEEGRLPTRRELDEWAGGAPVWVMSMDGHSGSCSTALLAELGLLGRVPDDGILQEADYDAALGPLTQRLMAGLTPTALARGAARFCNECASFGIGTVCAHEGDDAAGGPGGRDRTGELAAAIAQRLPLDLRLYPQYMDEAKLARVAGRMGAPRAGGCMKWELDGSVGSHSAAFDAPYLDGTRGALKFSTEELDAKIHSLDARGCQVTAHAIGELAIEQLLGIYERLGAGGATGGDGAPAAVGSGSAASAAPCRHRIDHCEFPAPAEVERLCALRPFVTVQPGYAWFDARWLHSYERALPPEKRAQELPLRTLAQAGVPLLGSSDSPVQSLDPYLQMRGMREPYVEGEGLSGFEALQTYTVNGGRSLGEKKGLLREGWEASFFAVDRDLERIPPDRLEGLRASALWLHGKRYRPLPEDDRALARLATTPPRKI